MTGANLFGITTLGSATCSIVYDTKSENRLNRYKTNILIKLVKPIAISSRDIVEIEYTDDCFNIINFKFALWIGSGTWIGDDNLQQMFLILPNGDTVY